jgi:hypothetical protein
MVFGIAFGAASGANTKKADSNEGAPSKNDEKDSPEG